MKLQKNQNGFAILEIILLLVTLGFIVAIAWVVMKHANQSPYKKIIQTPVANYIEITEWKVKLTVPDELKKVSYKIVDAEHPNDIIISSEDLDKFIAEHKECSNASKYNIISRLKEGSAVNGVAWQQIKESLEKQGAKNLGAYYYFDSSRPSGPPCSGTNIVEIQKLNTQAYDLFDQLPTYENIVINP